MFPKDRAGPQKLFNWSVWTKFWDKTKPLKVMFFSDKSDLKWAAMWYCGRQECNSALYGSQVKKFPPTLRPWLYYFYKTALLPFMHLFCFWCNNSRNSQDSVTCVISLKTQFITVNAVANGKWKHCLNCIFYLGNNSLFISCSFSKPKPSFPLKAHLFLMFLKLNQSFAIHHVKYLQTILQN